VKIQTLLLSLAAIAVATSAAAQPPRPKDAITILIRADSSLRVDGQPATSAQLDAALTAAAAHKKVVMYFREKSNAVTAGHGHGPADSVIDLIIKHGMPMCFSADAAFTACK